ncbi:MAG: hypothetical protein AAF386_00925 [Pseudomonadota bacterium]
MGRKLLKWNEWQPGLDTDTMTLAQVLGTMPKSDADDVPEIVRHYENPESPDALPGAITLERHDCLHVILGRGLHVQDEAFIIGVTMGADTTRTSDITETFIEISTTLYPKAWQFEPDHIASYRLGVGYAMDNLRGKDLHLTPFEKDPYQSQTVAQLRRDLGIVKEELRAYFRKEELLVPGSRASRRMDTYKGRSDSDLT